MNNESRFTPGPWFKKGKKVFWTKPDKDLPKDNLFNGLICICATTEDDPPEVIEEACANAALIATAPKMLAFLEECWTAQDSAKFLAENVERFNALLEEAHGRRRR